MEKGEIRFYQWGNEKPGNATIWTVIEKDGKREVVTLGEVDLWNVAIYTGWKQECPYD